jgi:hypothetical protein
MTIQKLLGAAITMFLMSAGAASATTALTTGNDDTITVTVCSTSTSCTSTSTPFTGNTPSINSVLTISSSGETISSSPVVQNLFTVDPASSSGETNNMVSGTIQVEILFQNKSVEGGVTTIKTLGTLYQDGTFLANYTATTPPPPSTLTPGLSCSSSTGQSDCIYWGSLAAPLTDYNTKGERNNVSTVANVIDLVTLSNGLSFDVNFYDAQDWDLTPGVSFTTFGVGGGAGGATPLPATLPLFAGGLSVMGLFGWRRKRKAAANAV